MKRYPGIRPFRTDEKGLFFGRDADIKRLHRLIGLEQLIILYGKSGYGKSSLLSAGIFPRLEAEGKRHFHEIRFGPHKPGDSMAPADAARQALLRTEPGAAGSVKKEKPGLLPKADPSLWLALKNRQQAGQNSFLLVFDQFEELFSYPAEQILEFKKQLAEALYSRVPKRYEAALASAGLNPEQEDRHRVRSVRPQGGVLHPLRPHEPAQRAEGLFAQFAPARVRVGGAGRGGGGRSGVLASSAAGVVFRYAPLRPTPPPPSPPFSPPCATNTDASRPAHCRSCAGMWRTTWSVAPPPSPPPNGRGACPQFPMGILARETIRHSNEKVSLQGGM